MAKGQQKTTFNDASGLLNALEGPTVNQLNTANSQLGSASSAFGALNPAGIGKILQPATDVATDISKTGGYSAPQLNTLEGAESTNLGGLDPAALSKISTQYQDLISSGGISDATAAAMQRQATSGVSGIYGVLEDKLNRSRAVTGGQGGAGETAQMARQLGQSEANAITGVNADVGRLRQQGTEAGLSGASNLQAAQAAARDAAARTYSGTQSGVAGGRQVGGELLSGLNRATVSGGLQSAGGLADIGGIEGNIYGKQLSTELGLLDSMSGIANRQKGPLQNFEDIYSMVTAPLQLTKGL